MENKNKITAEDFMSMEPILITFDDGEQWSHPYINEIYEDQMHADRLEGKEGPLIKIIIESDAGSFSAMCHFGDPHEYLSVLEAVWSLAWNDEKEDFEDVSIDESVEKETLDALVSLLDHMLIEDCWAPGGHQFCWSELGKRACAILTAGDFHSTTTAHNGLADCRDKAIWTLVD
jgi:hypothetical protein